MSYIDGHDCHIYRNTGTYADPDWSEIEDLMNLASPLQKDMTEKTPRRHAPYKAKHPGLREVPVEFDLLYDPENAHVAAFQSAWWADEQIELLILDGESDVAGSTGVRASFEIAEFNRQEPEGDMATVHVKLEVGLSDNVPEEYTVTT